MLIYFVDHPAYHYQTIRAPLPHLAVTFVTASEVNFCQRHVRNDIAVEHLLHAAEPAHEALPPWEARDIPLLLSASLHGDPDVLRAGWRTHGADVERQLQAIVDAQDEAPERPLGETVTRVLGRDDLPIEVLASFFAATDFYIRTCVRRDLVMALSDLPLMVCGKGWERVAETLAARGKKVSFLPSQPAPTTMAFMRRSKIVINPMPPFYRSHERPLQAMAAGAVAALDRGSHFLLQGQFDAALAMPRDRQETASMLAALLTDDTRLAGDGHRRHAVAAGSAYLGSSCRVAARPRGILRGRFLGHVPRTHPEFAAARSARSSSSLPRYARH